MVEVARVGEEEDVGVRALVCSVVAKSKEWAVGEASGDVVRGKSSGNISRVGWGESELISVNVRAVMVNPVVGVEGSAEGFEGAAITTGVQRPFAGTTPSVSLRFVRPSRRV